MNATYDPRLLMPEPTAGVHAHTWRVLLSLPGRVGMVDPSATTELMRIARAAFQGEGDPA